MKHVLFLLFFPFLVSAQSLDWQVFDQDFTAGDTVTADFTVYGFNQITAYQFAMRYDTGVLAFIGVTFPPGNPMDLTTGCFSWHGKPGYNVKPGELRHGRSMPYGETFADGTSVFSYVFKAKQSGMLSQKCTLATCCLSPPLNPMSYRWVLEYQPLTVAYISAQELVGITENFEDKISIYPNPATDAITIECSAPMQVEIYNALGTLTYSGTVIQDAFTPLHKGSNIVRITDGKNVLIKTVFRL